MGESNSQTIEEVANLNSQYSTIFSGYSLEPILELAGDLHHLPLDERADMVQGLISKLPGGSVKGWYVGKINAIEFMKNWWDRYMSLMTLQQMLTGSQSMH